MTTLDEVQALADQLSADEQAQLIAYLAHRRAPAALPQSGPWADLFRIMDEIAANTAPDAPSITEELITSRR